MEKINISSIIFDSIVDGPGLRTVIFTQGCSHACVGCHNPETWCSKDNTLIELDAILSHITDNTDSKKITLSGGDPLEQYEPVLELCKKLSLENYHIILYTGYELEVVQKKFPEILKKIDVLIDGRYEEKLHTASIPFIGSTNQKYIELKNKITST